MTDGKHIPVGVFEPGNSLLKPADNLLDIGHFPAERSQSLCWKRGWKAFLRVLFRKDNTCGADEETVYNSQRLATASFLGQLLTLYHREGYTMGHAARLQLIGRVTYYAGWIALLFGGLMHLNIARNLFLAVNLSKRNLFEASIACFVICMASEVRARDAAVERSGGVRKAA